MAGAPLARVLRHVRRLLSRDASDASADSQLLSRFVADRDDSAFALLVQRHGPLVLRVCQQVLRHEDAADTFQATFLVLACKARSVRRGESLPGWLHRVAHRIALRARADAGRRRRQEQEAAMTRPEATPAPEADDLGPVLHQEVDALPRKYRLPVVLCYLGGKTNEEAAGELGWPVGTVKTRLTQARQLLRRRLTRRGVTLAAPGLGLVAAETTASALPPALADSTVTAAVLFTTGQAAGVISPPAAALAKGVLHMMFLRKVTIGAGLLLVLAVVGSAGLLWPAGQAASPPVPAPRPAPAAQSRPVTVIQPEQVKADKAAVVAGNTDLAADLYGKLRGEQGNLFFSPYSISAALAMTYTGARGQTAAEMEKTLHFPVGQERLHPALAALLQESRGQGKNYQLHVVNALWGQKDYAFRADFLDTTRDHYGARLHAVNYREDVEGSRQTVNAWVEKETQGKIKDLLSPGVVTVDTRLVLTNAVYFKAEWERKFRGAQTTQQPFRTAAGAEVKVPLMDQRADLRYCDYGSFQGLELPYKDKDLALVVFLPKKADGLSELEQSLTGTSLVNWLKKLEPHDVQVYLPKFQTSFAFRLKQMLRELGMADAFVPGVADLSGIGGKPGELFIQEVVHKAFVSVTEAGTEAGAATGVVVDDASAPPVFRADHPFLFLVRDNRSGSIMFLGRLVDPRL
jgi:RNA polymerase sigma factor (sigma-70 family)